MNADLLAFETCRPIGVQRLIRRRIGLWALSALTRCVHDEMRMLNGLVTYECATSARQMLESRIPAAVRSTELPKSKQKFNWVFQQEPLNIQPTLPKGPFHDSKVAGLVVVGKRRIGYALRLDEMLECWVAEGLVQSWWQLAETALEHTGRRQQVKKCSLLHASCGEVGGASLTGGIYAVGGRGVQRSDHRCILSELTPCIRQSRTVKATLLRNEDRSLDLYPYLAAPALKVTRKPIPKYPNPDVVEQFQKIITNPRTDNWHTLAY